MKRIVVQISALLLAATAFSMDTAELLENSKAKAIFDKKCIRLGTSEVLPIDFNTACTVLMQEELVKAVQQEFARSIADENNPEFPIIGNGDGEYHYMNEKGKRTNIRELYRKQTNEHTFDLIIWASGKRFFGGYDVIIHLQVIDVDQAGIVYSVNTHAYPRNWATRFSARKIGRTKRYFKKKMQTISWVAREIAIGLCEKEEFQNRWMEGTSRNHEVPSPVRP